MTGKDPEEQRLSIEQSVYWRAVDRIGNYQERGLAIQVSPVVSDCVAARIAWPVWDLIAEHIRDQVREQQRER